MAGFPACEFAPGAVCYNGMQIRVAFILMRGALGHNIQRIIETHRKEIAELCRRFYVRQLEVFGSAATDRFDPDTSDLDFLVEFGAIDTEEYADAYFGLLEGLEVLFAKPVDLVSANAIRNPFFAKGVDSTRQTVYAARISQVLVGRPTGR